MKARYLVLPVILCLVGSSVAQADSLGTVNLRYENTNPAGFATIHRPGYDKNITVWTGQYNLELAAGPPAGSTDETKWLYDAAVNGIIGTFCADIREDAPVGKDFVSYDIVMPEFAPVGNGNSAMSDEKANDLRRLFDAHRGEWQLGNTAENNLAAAAFALCVWEVIFETSSTYSVSDNAGDFYSTGTWTTNWAATSARDTANSWLDAVQAARGDPVPNIPLRILANEGKQDYAIVVPRSGGEPPIPEPLTVLGLLLGTGGVAGYLRKRKAA